MTPSSSRLRIKTRLLACVVILSNVLGNFWLSRGLKTGYLNAWIVLGVSLLIVWMLSRMTLLSWADLTYVLPVTAFGYVLTALMGRLFLAEQVSPARWAGIAVIVAGVWLVGDTPIRTTPGERVREDEP
ncbi:MAG: EamA family transporter [Bryobacteraceae bacterium]